ncbi:hypothetical protein S83_062574, partial [Arachis hypogaea]
TLKRDEVDAGACDEVVSEKNGEVGFVSTCTSHALSSYASASLTLESELPLRNLVLSLSLREENGDVGFFSTCTSHALSSYASASLTLA